MVATSAELFVRLCRLLARELVRDRDERVQAVVSLGILVSIDSVSAREVISPARSLLPMLDIDSKWSATALAND
ncbi:hypothetical protein BH24PSE2_BH24PSE2_15940 [soil metagenome]